MYDKNKFLTIADKPTLSLMVIILGNLYAILEVKIGWRSCPLYYMSGMSTVRKHDKPVVLFLCRYLCNVVVAGTSKTSVVFTSTGLCPRNV